MYVVWAAIGGISLGLGLLGVVLPLLPTVPFILLAAYCFARSSPKWHAWLLEHRHFGPLIDNWSRNGAIGKGAKQAATVSVSIVFMLSVLLGAAKIVLAVQAIVLALVLLFIWTRPTR